MELPRALSVWYVNGGVIAWEPRNAIAMSLVAILVLLVKWGCKVRVRFLRPIASVLFFFLFIYASSKPPRPVFLMVTL